MITSHDRATPANSDPTVPDDSPTEAYVRWLLADFDEGRWYADTSRPRLAYKVYRDAPRIPLDARFPLRLGSSRQAILDDMPGQPCAHVEQALAWTLYYTHGLTRVLRLLPNNVLTQPVPATPTEFAAPPVSLPFVATGPQPERQLMLGRPVPSGGDLHPLELYLAVRDTETIPAGVHHYDPTQHALDVLREGDFLPEIAHCLPGAEDFSACRAVLIAAVFFQKNHQKYTNLSYRLQALDAGVVVEQIRFVARRFGLDAAAALRFLDAPLHHLIGLDSDEEQIYAVLPLYEPHPLATRTTRITNPPSRALDDLPPVPAHYEQLCAPEPLSPLLKKLYAAALLHDLPTSPESPRDSSDSTPSIVQAPAMQRQEIPPSGGMSEAPPDGWIALPQPRMLADPDLAHTLLARRRTGFGAIDTQPLALADLATLLACTARARSRNWERFDSRIYAAVLRVPEIPAGVYRYHPLGHALEPANQTDPIPLLNRLTTAPNIQPYLAPVNLYITANHRRARAEFGERGLRMVGIELGRAVQRTAVIAAALDLACHTHLSYRIGPVATDLLRVPVHDALPLVSMMIAHPRRANGPLLEAAW